MNSLVRRLPNSITTVVGGVILASGDYALPFLLATPFYVIGISGFYGVFRRTKPRPEPPTLI